MITPRLLGLLAPLLLCVLGLKCAKTEDDSLNRAPITQEMMSLGKGMQTFGVACYYYDAADARFGEGGLFSGQSWVWAVDDANNSVNMAGHFEDGFLAVDNMDYKDAKHFCENGIQRKSPNKSFELYKMMAKKRVISFYDYPATFRDEEKDSKMPRIVVFGDSLSDNGNLKAWVRLFPSPPYFLGHFTNGPNWTDYLSKEADVTVQNWAYGGAQSEPHNDSSVSEIIDYVQTVGRNFITGSMSRYIRHFVNDYLHDRRMVAPDKTLFVLWIGGNDYLSKSDTSGAINRLIDTPTEQGGAEVVARRTVASIIDHLDFLYRVGARNFLVMNLPNLGVTPMVAVDVNYRKNDNILEQSVKRYLLSERLSEAVGVHNRELKIKLEEERQNHQDARIIELDMNAAMTKLLHGQDPTSDAPYDYGFDLASLTTKLSIENLPDIIAGKACYSGGYAGSNDSKLTCSSVKKALYFDLVHPTTQGHCWISYFVHRELYSAGLIAKAPDLKEYELKCKGK
jgi:thermolabile hemolysin